MKTNLMKDYVKVQKFRRKQLQTTLGAPPEMDTDTDKKEESGNTALTHGNKVLTSGNILFDLTTKCVNINLTQWMDIVSFVQ